MNIIPEQEREWPAQVLLALAEYRHNTGRPGSTVKRPDHTNSAGVINNMNLLTHTGLNRRKTAANKKNNVSGR
jgi:hypothetical protein